VSGGSVVYGLESDTGGGFCLPAGQLAISGVMVAQSVYDPLTWPNAEGEYVPYLAESVTPNDDYTEMATFFWVEARIGLGWALGLALATAVIGSILVKRAGLSVLARIQQRIGQSQMPGRELSDGAAVLVAGAFLISPGFLTDAIGFLLLVPVVRARIYRVASKRLASRFTVFTATGQTFRSRRADLPPAGGEIIDIDPEDVE
jgi:UPF0716 protein FxsA